MYTVKDLTRDLRNHKGRVYCDMVTHHDLVPMQVVKADLLGWLKGMSNNEPAPLVPFDPPVRGQDLHLHAHDEAR